MTVTNPPFIEQLLSMMGRDFRGLVYSGLTTTCRARYYYCACFTGESTGALRKGHRDSEHEEKPQGHQEGIREEVVPLRWAPGPGRSSQIYGQGGKRGTRAPRTA